MTHENRLGMFIHWGIYAVTGSQEQVFARSNLTREEYDGLVHEFNPVKYDPDEWVSLASEAGMKYICFTAKHHDGFCMWDTKYTDYNIMNTPYGSDVLAMLADACHRHKMALSIYYSNPDWNHPNGYNPASTHQWKAKRGAIDTCVYREYVKNQVRELLTGYGPIYTFFWDIPPGIYDPSLNELVRSLQPGILINDRGWSEGDFATPERADSKPGSEGYEKMTEACNSVGVQSWGYRADEDFYSLRYLKGQIDNVMARGGSYLLNVGPNAEGVITDEYASRIRAVGEWYRRMDGCLECHEPDDFRYHIRAERATLDRCVVRRKDGKSYFHFSDGLEMSAIYLKYFPNLPKRVRLMNTGESLRYAIEPLPQFFEGGVAQENLRISGIPIDSLAGEPVVIEVTW